MRPQLIFSCGRVPVNGELNNFVSFPDFNVYPWNTFAYNVAKFAAVKEIRDKVTPMQRKMGETQDIIMEGRDICTVVFPNADVKIYLDCSTEERANRRYKQNIEKGIQTLAKL